MKPSARMRKTRFPFSLFAMFLAVLLLMSGLHTGIIVFLNAASLSDPVQVLLPIAYWSLVALALTIFTRYKIVKTYDKPMKALAEATDRVAHGDFSVFIPTLHTADRLDYLDLMFLDFNKMVAELGSIETMKTDFISNVSHELKTPLAVISNYAQMLQGDNLSAEQRQEYLDTILSNVRRLSELVANILKLNKIENQVIKQVAAPYDLCGQLSECALLFEDAWEGKGLDFVFETEERAVICADREMMSIVWSNLLSNAIKFTPEGGRVRLVQTSDEESVTVTVSDTGCGMRQETMTHIFEKFYQGDTSHSTAGNGLGLALALRILQLSGSTITVTSRLGEGSAFAVRIPVHTEEET